MNVVIYTFCYNEIKILPFAEQYWRRFASKVVVYDNGSTDGSLEFLSKVPYVEIRHYDTNNELDDLKLRSLKNSVWKESRDVGVDFVVVSDLDECIWARDLDCTLTKLKQSKVGAITPKMCNLISTAFPQFSREHLMHELVGRYYVDIWPSNDGPGSGAKQKMLVFDPNAVCETNYKVGCYESHPTVKEGYSSTCTDDILCMHLHDVGLARKIMRYSERAARMSKSNVILHLSDFYLETPVETTNDFMNDLKRSEPLEELLK